MKETIKIDAQSVDRLVSEQLVYQNGTQGLVYQMSHECKRKLTWGGTLLNCENEIKMAS